MMLPQPAASEAVVRPLRLHILHRSLLAERLMRKAGGKNNERDEWPKSTHIHYCIMHQ